jgi:hypothetical protein
VKRLLLALALLAAGCGGAAPPPKPRQPHLPRALAATWRTQANAVAEALAARDGCTAKEHATALRASVIDAIQSGRVAPRFQEELLAAVNDLPDRIGCTPPPAPVVEPGPPPKHEHDHGHKHGHHGKGDEG